MASKARGGTRRDRRARIILVISSEKRTYRPPYGPCNCRATILLMCRCMSDNIGIVTTQNLAHSVRHCEETVEAAQQQARFQFPPISIARIESPRVSLWNFAPVTPRLQYIMVPNVGLPERVASVNARCHAKPATVMDQFCFNGPIRGSSRVTRPNFTHGPRLKV